MGSPARPMGSVAAVVVLPLFLALLHAAVTSGLLQPQPRVILTFEGKKMKKAQCKNLSWCLIVAQHAFTNKFVSVVPQRLLSPVMSQQ